ncbi:hypothetical protein HN51_049910, partial [Arachis hypogaea]
MEREGSVNTVRIEVGTEVEQLQKKVVSVKKRKASVGGSKQDMIDLEGGGQLVKEPTLEVVETFISNQKELHFFKGIEDTSSLWSNHYLFAKLSEKHAQAPSYVKFVNDISDVVLDQYLQ